VPFDITRDAYAVFVFQNYTSGGSFTTTTAIPISID